MSDFLTDSVRILVQNIHSKSRDCSPFNYICFMFQEFSTFVRVKHLSCGTKYQFKITPVARFGVIGESRVSDWITTPTGNYFQYLYIPVFFTTAKEAPEPRKLSSGLKVSYLDITIMRLCNILQFFTALKTKIFR